MLAMLDRMIMALDAYVSTAPPREIGGSPAPSSDSGPAESPQS
jgi:hypothetical protein